MFEYFNDRAIKGIILAQEEARRDQEMQKVRRVQEKQADKKKRDAALTKKKPARAAPLVSCRK